MHVDVVMLITRLLGPRHDEVSEPTEPKCENTTASLILLRNAVTNVSQERTFGESG